MELDCKNIFTHIFQAFISSVIDIYKGWNCHACIHTPAIHHIAVILGRNIDTSGL